MPALSCWDLIALAVLGTVPLAYAWRRTQGTTLRAPVAWAWLAWMGLMLGEWLARQSAAGPAAAWRQMAAVGTFCPAMAVLGAKRPQDSGWQFIVASLWLVLALPALQALAFSPTGLLDPHPAWRGLHVLLLIVAATNYLPTRHGMPALLACGVQWRLLHIAAPGETTAWYDRPLFLLCVLLALLVATAVRERRAARKLEATRRHLDSPEALHLLGWDRVWIDFRNAFGCVWALRVSERINHAAQQSGARIELTWQGFARRPAGAPEAAQEASPETQALTPSGMSPIRPEELSELEVTAMQMLRRFVSPAWIDARRGVSCAAPLQDEAASPETYA